MVSAWDVYWVMQLNSINGVLLAFAILFSAASIVWFVTRAIGVCGEKYAADVSNSIRRAPVLMATVLIAYALIPSSGTAAAMILLPALTSEQVVAPVTAEAKELYALAKQALRELGKTEPEKESQK